MKKLFVVCLMVVLGCSTSLPEAPESDSDTGTGVYVEQATEGYPQSVKVKSKKPVDLGSDDLTIFDSDGMIIEDPLERVVNDPGKDL